MSNESSQTTVKINRVPIEMNDMEIRNAISAYGPVESIKNNQWKDLPYACYNDIKLINELKPEESEKKENVNSAVQQQSGNDPQNEVLTNEQTNTDVTLQNEPDIEIEEEEDINNSRSIKREILTRLSSNTSGDNDNAVRYVARTRNLQTRQMKWKK
ncbi:hypothetical protein HHI36_016527 [Cryptolaemus montrouzieri]|uniref:RRM domain-containing protein n=1 Tax=Cryptolaemus montrouzieri TaxID=559131 RepID=A0ABD2NKV1_9CUCU